MNSASSPKPTETRPVPEPARHPVRFWLGLLLFACLVTAVVIAGIRPRLRARAALVGETADLSVASVAVIHPQRSAPVRELVLPANLQAFTDSPIYARTSGYLKSWSADIGAQVKAGQLIAEIDTPEVDQELAQVTADLATAQANLHTSQITNDRYQGLLKQDGVSRQDADNTAGDLQTKQSMVQSADANLKRLSELENFKHIYAPFDGIITARNVDVGALINAGSSQRELFHIAATNEMRVYVNVPQGDSAMAKPGLSADLVLPQFPGHRFHAKLASTAGAIDPATRTLLVQFLAENPTGELLPGDYAELHLGLDSGHPAFQVPVAAIVFRGQGTQVVVIENRKTARLRPVVLGRDYGSMLEVIGGLTGDDWIVTNPPDSIIDGQTVRVVNSGNTAPATEAAH